MRLALACREGPQVPETRALPQGLALRLNAIALQCCRQIRSPRSDGPDGLHQVLGALVFRRVAERSGFERVRDTRRVLDHADEEDPLRRIAAKQLVSDGDAADAVGKNQVEEHHVGTRLADHLHRFMRQRRLGNHARVAVQLEQELEALAEDGMVVD